MPDQQQAAVPQRLSEATIQLWASGQPTSREREIFLQIIASMDSKPGFNIRVDISSEIGSTTQAIRFENEITNETISSLYYSTTDVSTFEERIAPALCLELDHGIVKLSRFCRGYHNCVKRGTMSVNQSTYAVIWSDY